MRPSLYNYAPEARATLRLPERVVLNDVTLREGVQAAIHPFTATDKLKLALLLADIGLSQIQVGYPTRSEVDREVLALLKDERIDSQVEVMCTAAPDQWEEEVGQASRSGADLVNVIFPTSDPRLERMGWSRERMLRRVEDAVRLAKEAGVAVSFSPVDCTRTSLEVLKEVLAVATSAGADRFYLIDTSGVIYPLGMRHMVTEIKKVSTIPLAVHCHNDLGMALANSLIAVECGVEIVDVSVNGLGKRAGNAALDEVAVALWLLHDLDLGLRMDGMYSLSQTAAAMTGVEVKPSKPFAGRDAFDFEVDSQLQREKAHVSWGAIEPAQVGHPG